MAKIVNKSKVNPSSPIFYLKIGETEVTYSKTKYSTDNVMSFSMKLTSLDVASDIQIIIFDETSLLFEWEILKGYKDVKFKFGQDLANLSQLYSATITDYNLSFVAGGSQLTIDLILGGAGSTTSSEESKTYTGTPSEIIREIAEEEGWKIGKIINCDPGTSQDFNRTGQTAIDFIKEVLIPKAKSNHGSTNYTFFTSSDEEGNTVINFVPQEEYSISNYAVYEMTVGQDHEAVIEFTPTFTGLMYNLLGQAPPSASSAGTSSTTESASGTGEYNEAGEPVGGSNNTEANINDNQVNQNSQLGVSVPSIDTLTNNLVHAYSDNKSLIRRIGTSSYKASEMGKMAEYLFSKSVMLSNSAELELRGDASIVPQSFVVMMVLTKDGYFHHSSGLYQVLEVSHDLDMGNFTTTLNMFRRGMQVAEDGTITLLDVASSIFNPVAGANQGGSMGGNTTASSGDPTIDKCFYYFKNKGCSIASACGILGNIKGESNFSTTISNKSSGATGMFQWLGSRLTNLKKKSNWNSVDTQLDFAWSEFTGSECKSSLDKFGGLSKFQGLTDVEKATLAWEQIFERSGGQGNSKRVQYAKEFYQIFSASGGNMAGSFVSEQEIRQHFDSKYKGKPYVWGGKGYHPQRGYDCSGFCGSMLAELVKAHGGSANLLGSTDDYLNNMSSVQVPWDKSKFQPGDCLVFIGNQSGGRVNRHVVMVVNQTTICHAGSPLKYGDINEQMKRFETGKHACVRPLALKRLYKKIPSGWEGKIKG